jgi:hypothetical protein
MNLRQESLKEVKYLGCKMVAGLWVWEEGGKTKKEPFCHIHGLSPRCPFLDVLDDSGDPLRGVSHAIEAGKTIVDYIRNNP